MGAAVDWSTAGSANMDSNPKRSSLVAQTAAILRESIALRDPGCMASIFRCTFPAKDTRSCILCAGPDSPKRNNGTVFLSSDEGKTWPVKKVLFPGRFAYSVLTALPDGTVGSLFETDDANRIVFACFTLDWLTGASTYGR